MVRSSVGRESHDAGPEKEKAALQTSRLLVSFKERNGNGPGQL